MGRMHIYKVGQSKKKLVNHKIGGQKFNLSSSQEFRQKKAKTELKRKKIRSQKYAREISRLLKSSDQTKNT